MEHRKIQWQMCLVTVAALLALTAVPAEAAIMVVDDDGLASATDCNAATLAFPTITLAVAAASPSDTIKVCPGLYAEQVSIINSLNVQGTPAIDALSLHDALPI